MVKRTAQDIYRKSRVFIGNHSEDIAQARISYVKDLTADTRYDTQITDVIDPD